MLCKWDELPEFMKTEEVYPYYEILDRRRGSLLKKRVFDIVMSTVMIIALSPVLLVIAIWIKLDSPGTVLYRQERVTQYGRVFRICKFRTMVTDADKKGSLVTVQGDDRITNVGKKLRRCRLDELPQLFNIWKGDMSFVGTRPEVMKYVQQYTNEMNATLLLPAGVTSEASIRYKDEADILENAKSGKDIDRIYIHEILPLKMNYNLKSIEKYTFIEDIKVMIYTLLLVLK